MDKVFQQKQDCSGCTACANVCPAKAITMQTDEEGFSYPAIKGDRCIDCLLCQKVCPARQTARNIAQPEVYAVKNRDQTIRSQSSSGGFFTLVAQAILDRGGAVFGASFNEEFLVDHIMVETKKDLSKLRGSKYVQSNPKDTFQQAQTELAKGRPVLFTGTPCQVAGLAGYLQKPYDNLFLVDFVCHGAPSPGVFSHYLAHLKKQHRAEIQELSFRAKELAPQALRVKFSNDRIYWKKGGNDLYYKSFYKNLTLRPSCYECKHKNLNTPSDITMGDYWGVSTRFPAYNEKEGVSLVIINTDKGKTLFNQVSHQMEMQQSDLEHAVKYNYPINRPSRPHERREAFFTDYRKDQAAVHQHLKKHLKQNIFKRIFKKRKG